MGKTRKGKELDQKLKRRKAMKIGGFKETWKHTSRNLLNSWLSCFEDSPKPRKTPYLQGLQHFLKICKSIVTYRKSV